MPKILHCDKAKNGIELISSTEGRVIYFEKKSEVKLLTRRGRLKGHRRVKGYHYGVLQAEQLKPVWSKNTSEGAPQYKGEVTWRREG